MSHQIMTPERIAEIRTMPHDNWRIVHDLLDEIQRLQPSQAPVGGGVPDQEWNGPLLWDLLRMDSDEPDWEDAASRVRDWFVSRLPALKTGEVVVPDIPADRVLGEALADLENAVRFLAKQESSLFEIRGKAIRLLAQGEIEAAKDLITMKWPIIQGLRNQLDIAEVGKQACDIKRVRPAIDHMLRAQPTQEPAP